MMKELSIEEKAKRYDGLIERLKDLQFAYRFSPLSDTIEENFPELKESEDERMKEAIIATIHLYYGEPLEDEAKEMIAWLERQGEKKSEEVDNLHNYLYGEQKPAGKVDQHSLPVSDDSSLPTFDESIYHPCTENAYEQEPAEWSEEDDDDAWLNDIISKAECNLQLNKDEIDWLKSLKERCCPQKHWKPTEEMLEALYRTIPQNVMEKSENEILLDKLYQGLKYGRILSK